MSQPCTICQHVDRDAIDTALVRGEILRKVALTFGSSEAALHRHKTRHLAPRLSQAKQDQDQDQAHANDLAGQVQRQEATDVVQATSLLQEVRALRSKAYSILLSAEQSGDLRIALAGVREARGCLELLAEMEGSISKQPIVNLVVDPAWLVIRGVILSALRPFPQACIAVADQLAALEAGHARD